MKVNIANALEIIAKGGVIAYPTETTFGLGCDATNQQALQKLITIKQRCQTKGFIALIKDYQQLELLVSPPSKTQMTQLKAAWPGPYTFVFPSPRPYLPKLLTGQYSSLAIRMSSHPIAQSLCQNTPITSTSANISGQDVVTQRTQLQQQFGHLLDGIVEGQPGHQAASQIIDIVTGKRYR